MTYEVRWCADKAGCDVIAPWGTVHVTWKELSEGKRDDETEDVAAVRLAAKKLWEGGGK